MAEDQKKINELLAKLETLLQKQEDFQKEINELQNEIAHLKHHIAPSQEVDSPPKKEPEATPSPKPKVEDREEPPVERVVEKTVITYPEQKQVKQPFPPLGGKPAKKESNLEKFIGENLISKIGIIITIIGVGIGVNYAIDKDLITPLMRIILGYCFSGVLLFFSLLLKKKYNNFSAVLISGSIASAYFITYAAFSFYGFIPRLPAFAIMCLMTVAAVYVAISYNKQLIAIIGLVGAYAVPFLLSDDSRNFSALFIYMAIINGGIVVLAFKKYWKLLFNTAFIITWLVYATWFTLEFEHEQHLLLGLGFSFLFFFIFYTTFLANKLLRKLQFSAGDIVFVMANGFIFYSLNYLALDQPKTEGLLGGFTLANAILHLITAFIVYLKKADDKLFYLLIGMALIFVTIFVPVQLDGRWVSLLWAGEAAVLYWIGRSKKTTFYENLSYLMVFISFFSMIHDWSIENRFYDPSEPDTYLTPLFNTYFLNSILFSACFAVMSLVSTSKRYEQPAEEGSYYRVAMNFFIPGIFIVATYLTFFSEINMYWKQLYADSIVAMHPDVENPLNSGLRGKSDIIRFQLIWLLNYTLAFLGVFSLLNTKLIKSKEFGWLNLILNIMALPAIFTLGFEVLGNLRESFIQSGTASSWNIGIRYLTFALGGLLVYTCHEYLKKGILGKTHPLIFDAILHIFLLAVCSNELITWLELAGSGQSHKLGLSILWGVYSLILIILGIARRKQHLRIAAMVLFGVTLIKLIFYDLSHLNTISKTIVFVSLGILLLIISFLYNKFKGNIFEAEEKQNSGS